MDGCHIDEVKAKLDSVHNLLVGKKQVQFAAEAETFEPTAQFEEKDVKFVNGTGFQGYTQRSQFRNHFSTTAATRIMVPPIIKHIIHQLYRLG